MNKLKGKNFIKSSILIVGFLAFSYAAVESQSEYSKYFANVRGDDTCEHVGNYYKGLDATLTEKGYKSFEVCCKCHKKFVVQDDDIPSSGTFADDNGTWTVSNASTISEISGFNDDLETGSLYTYKTPFTLNKSFIYRIGNENSFNPTAVFGGADSVYVMQTYSSDTVSVTTTNGQCKFTGTGVIKLAPSYNGKYDADSAITVEVVNATNATSMTNATDKDVVLLNNVTYSDNLYTISNGHYFYGNGFTITANGAGQRNSNSGMGEGFINVLDGGVLDNAGVICKIFPRAYMYTSGGSDYGLFDTENSAGGGRYYYQWSAVAIKGNSKITNCYIKGARNNIFVGPGDVTIDNVTCESGSLANIFVASGSGNNVNLNNVTTIQKIVDSSFNVSDTSTNASSGGAPIKVCGLGIICGTNEASSYPTINISGSFNQYNWMNSDDGDTVQSSQNASTVMDKALSDSTYKHSYNGDYYANEGIAFFTSNTPTINNTANSASYTLKTVYSNIVLTIQIYSINSNGSVNLNYPEYIPSTQGLTSLDVSYQSNSEYIEFSRLYNNTTQKLNYSLVVSLGDISSYSFMFSNLITKFMGDTYSYTVKNGSGTTITESSITLTEADALIDHSYVVTISSLHTYSNNGSRVNYSGTLSFNLVLGVTVPDRVKPSKVSDVAGTFKFVNRGGISDASDWNVAINALDGLKISYYSASAGEEKTIDFGTITIPTKGKLNGTTNTYVLSGTDYTLSMTSSGFHSTADNGMPVSYDNVLYFTMAAESGFVSTKTTRVSPSISYVFTDSYNNTLSFSKQFSCNYDSNATFYKYSTFITGTGGGSSGGGGGGCISANTLITMADGSYKLAKDVNAGDMVMIFNHETGLIDTAPVIFNDDQGMEAEYSNVINLTFTNGTSFKVIYEHGFFDKTLNEYVYINEDTYQDYVGHSFVTILNGVISETALVSSSIDYELIEWCSPVSYYHLDIITNDLLSMPGGIPGLFNMFEYGQDMKYNEAKMIEDINTYGLFKYSDFADLVSEEMFNAYPTKYFKVAIGKGLLTEEKIMYYIQRYGGFTD